MFIVLQIASYLLTFITFLPLVKDSYWIYRALEYPRFQKLLLIVSLLVLWAVWYFLNSTIDIYSLVALSISAVYLSIKIFPYTILSKKEVLTVREEIKNNSLKIFSANVYQYNKQYHRLLGQIKDTDPDLVLLLETDKNWMDGLEELDSIYKYSLKEPLDNTYGLLFYSRYELTENFVKYLVKGDVPSVEAKVILPSGKKVQIFGLHPEPPVPGESLTSKAKDKELMLVALRVEKIKMPCIVMGDLNDVAWSYTTSLFKKVSQLLDVRCGRGFYSTFSSRNRFLRFPLDYIFCSGHFGLYKMFRLPDNGSDHFPIFTHLVLRDELNEVQGKTESADSGERKEAIDMATKRV